MESNPISVSEFNALMNQTLTFAYPEVVVEGEVSGFKINQGKWVFFDLKDEHSVIGCFMTVYQLNNELEDGMLVRVKSSPQLTKWGKFSLTIKELELAGEGSVKRSFEILKAKFQKEGLFSEERKRKLPQYPERIGLVTSSQAAAYNDFITILKDRWTGLSIDHIQVQVQGPSAPEQIRKAVEHLNKLSTYDVIVIIRGGGSLEDLQAFNSEEVVRAIYASEAPTLVAIGHEDDITLAELVSDLRGSTPTDAARRLVPDKKELLDKITSIQQANLSSISNLTLLGRRILDNFFYGIESRINSMRIETAESYQAASNHLDSQMDALFTKLNLQKKLLKSLDPTAILSRGYSIARVSGRVIKSAEDYKVEDELVIQLHKGKIVIPSKGDDYAQKHQTKLKF